MANKDGIIAHNLRVFYFVDAFRAMWFFTSVWVAYELQYLTLSELTSIEAIIIGIQLILQLPTGALADLIGKKRMMFVGMLLYFLTVAVYSQCRSFNAFLFYAFLSGAAASSIDGTREALLFDTLKQENGEHRYPVIASKLSMIFQIVLAGATIIGGFLGQISYLYPMYLTAGFFLLAAFATFGFREPAIDSDIFTVKNYIRKTREGVGEIFKNPYIRKISLFYILVGSFTWVTVITFNMVLLTERYFSPAEIGVSVAVLRILNSVIIFRLAGITSVFTKARTFKILPLVIVICYLPGIINIKWLALVSVVGAMLISTARWNILTRFTNGEFSSRNRATAISTLSMIIGIIYVGVVGVSGFIMDYTGGVGGIFTILGLITLFTAVPLGFHLAKNYAE